MSVMTTHKRPDDIPILCDQHVRSLLALRKTEIRRWIVVGRGQPTGMPQRDNRHFIIGACAANHHAAFRKKLRPIKMTLTPDKTMNPASTSMPRW